MGASQRRKGATFEREVATLMGAKRNIGQARDGGDDITVGRFRVECKRRQTVGPMAKWMAQCVAACDREGDIPVVVARGDGDCFIRTVAHQKVSGDSASFRAWHKQETGKDLPAGRYLDFLRIRSMA